MIILEMLKLYLRQIDAYNIGRCIFPEDMLRESTQQFRFAAASYSRYYLDIGSIYQTLQLPEVQGPIYEFHVLSLYKLKIIYDL